MFRVSFTSVLSWLGPCPPHFPSRAAVHFSTRPDLTRVHFTWWTHSQGCVVFCPLPYFIFFFLIKLDRSTGRACSTPKETTEWQTETPPADQLFFLPLPFHSFLAAVSVLFVFQHVSPMSRPSTVLQKSEKNEMSLSKSTRCVFICCRTCRRRDFDVAHAVETVRFRKVYWRLRFLVRIEYLVLAFRHILQTNRVWRSIVGIDLSHNTFKRDPLGTRFWGTRQHQHKKQRYDLWACIINHSHGDTYNLP